MCLIKGKGNSSCNHAKCIDSRQNPVFFEATKKATYEKRSDFHKIKLSRNSKNEPVHLKVSNPHKQNSGTWRSFEDFREIINGIKAVAEWPNGTLFSKSDIDIQFFPYARKVATFNPLKDDYDYSLVLDVEEAAVYCGEKLL